MKTGVWPRPLITPLIVVFVAAHLTATVLAQRGEIRPANVLGPANAPVTIEFFGDLQCPQCARYEPTIKSVRAEFGDKVRMVYRHLPLNTHEHAELAACATDSATKAAEAYAHSMAPLLADDDALARKQIALAQGTTSGKLAAEMMRNESLHWKIRCRISLNAWKS